MKASLTAGCGPEDRNALTPAGGLRLTPEPVVLASGTSGALQLEVFVTEELHHVAGSATAVVFDVAVLQRPQVWAVQLL